MGFSFSKPRDKQQDQIEAVLIQANWKLLPSTDEARKKFEADGTLPKDCTPDHLELRVLLEEPLANYMIGQYAKKIKCFNTFLCWVDIQTYKGIPTPDFRKSKAMHIFHKYVKQGGIMEIGGVPESLRQKFEANLLVSKTNPDVLTGDFFLELQIKCFIDINDTIYQRFRKSDEYSKMKSDIKQSYNQVKVSDFDYMKKLGEGGFGMVVHCRKKTTGKHYAMKIQTKKGLLECYSDDPWRADFEKQAFASCEHPFIVNLDYAFQTEGFAIMVLGLATAGDLQQALNKAPNECLPENRVQFYSAEIVLALVHLHQMGLMYRDLKPTNVLLNADGHIQLVDLGGVVDAEGKTLGLYNEAQNMAPVFAQRFGNARAQNTANGGRRPSGRRENRAPARRHSIMGTFGYMAPEMVIMLTQSTSEKKGYSYSVDWWSLGITMYKLLTGYRPFAPLEAANATSNPEYAMLFQEINYPKTMSPEVINIMTRLLDVNEFSRLGSGPNGHKEIKEHPFFKDIVWNMLELKHIQPPFVPQSKVLNDTPRFTSFENMLKELGKDEWLKDKIYKEEQEYFASWDFTSDHTLRVEYGIANEEGQYESNAKVQQMMGDKREKSEYLMAVARNQSIAHVSSKTGSQYAPRMQT